MFKKVFVLIVLTLGILSCGYAFAASDLDFCLFPGRCGNEVPATPSQPSEPVKPPADSQTNNTTLPKDSTCFCFNVNCSEPPTQSHIEKPVDIAFLLDVSGTMAHRFKGIDAKGNALYSTPIDNAVTAINKILQDPNNEYGLNPSIDKVALLTFGNCGSIELNWNKDFRKANSAFGQRLSQIITDVKAYKYNPLGSAKNVKECFPAALYRHPTGKYAMNCLTNLDGGLKAAQDLFAKSDAKSKKILVVLTDGVVNARVSGVQPLSEEGCSLDGYPTNGKDACIIATQNRATELKKSNVVIYVVGYSYNATAQNYPLILQDGRLDSEQVKYPDMCWYRASGRVSPHPGANKTAEDLILKKIISGDVKNVNKYYRQDENLGGLLKILAEILKTEVTNGPMIKGKCANSSIIAYLQQKPVLTFNTTPQVIKGNAPAGTYTPKEKSNTISFDTKKIFVTRNGKKVPIFNEWYGGETLTFKGYVASGIKITTGKNLLNILNLNTSNVSYTNRLSTKTIKSFLTSKANVWVDSATCSCSPTIQSTSPDLKLISEISKFKCDAIGTVEITCKNSDDSKPSTSNCLNVVATMQFPSYVNGIESVDKSVEIKSLGNGKYEVNFKEIPINKTEKIAFNITNTTDLGDTDTNFYEQIENFKVSADWSWIDGYGNIQAGISRTSEQSVPKTPCFANLNSDLVTKFVCEKNMQNTNETYGSTTLEIGCIANDQNSPECKAPWIFIEDIPNFIDHIYIEDLDRLGLVNVSFMEKTKRDSDNPDGKYSLMISLPDLPTESKRKFAINWKTATMEREVGEEVTKNQRTYTQKFSTGFANPLNHKSEITLNVKFGGILQYKYPVKDQNIKLNETVIIPPCTYVNPTAGISSQTNVFTKCGRDFLFFTNITTTVAYSQSTFEPGKEPEQFSEIKYITPAFVLSSDNPLVVKYEPGSNVGTPVKRDDFKRDKNIYYLRPGALKPFGQKYVISLPFKLQKDLFYSDPNNNLLVEYYQASDYWFSDKKLIGREEFTIKETLPTSPKDPDFAKSCCYDIKLHKNFVEMKGQRKRCIAFVIDESESMTYLKAKGRPDLPDPPRGWLSDGGTKCVSEVLLSGIMQTSNRTAPNDFVSDEAFVVPFSKYPRRTGIGCGDPGRDSEGNHNNAEKCIAMPNNAGGGTGNLEDALYVAIKAVDEACQGNPFNQKLVFVYSDGIPTSYGINYSKDCDFSKATSENDFFNSLCFQGPLNQAKKAVEQNVIIIPAMQKDRLVHNDSREIEKFPIKPETLEIIGNKLMEAIKYPGLIWSGCTLGGDPFAKNGDLFLQICGGGRVSYTGTLIPGLEYIPGSGKSGEYRVIESLTHQDADRRIHFYLPGYHQAGNNADVTFSFTVGRTLGFQRDPTKEDFKDFRVDCADGSILKGKNVYVSTTVSANNNCTVK